MIADRRFDFARDLQLQGDLVAAEDLFVQATDLAPGFATAWFTLGEVREQLGDTPGRHRGVSHAREATDPGDRNGAGLRLMRLGAADLAGMPADLCDGAVRSIRAEIRCGAGGRSRLSRPGAAVRRRCSARAPRRAWPPCFARVIDLGCGTGLAARAFAAIAGDIIGIDLSPRMIERARATGLYAELEVAEIVRGSVPPAGRQRRSDPRRRRDGLSARPGAAAGRGRARAGARRAARVHASKPMTARASCWARGCVTPTARPARDADRSRRPHARAAGACLVAAPRAVRRCRAWSRSRPRDDLPLHGMPHAPEQGGIARRAIA